MDRAGLPKPGRSDELVDLDEQRRLSQLVREKFDEQVPKRPLKPSRSEHPDNAPLEPSSVVDIPEYAKFQTLSSHPETLIRVASGDPAEEFVETGYYTDLNLVDKSHHHTTGTGFIQIEKNGVVEVKAIPGGLVRTRSASNPGMNDWIPSSEEVARASSDKPGRSDP